MSGKHPVFSDKLNRLATVTVPGQSPTLYSYDEVGNLAGYTYPNGVNTTLQYDGLNRLTSLSAQGPQGTVASYQYTLGATGNRTGVTELSGRQVSYGYDNLYRLTSETITGVAMSGVVSYAYDAVGNRKQIASTLAAIPASGLLNYDANDRTATDTYDNSGNIVSQAGIADVYDYENHLMQHGYITYVYDGDGNRVGKTIGGVTTNYLVDSLNPTGYAQVLDEVQSNFVTRSYTWGLELVSEDQVDTSIQPPLNPWVTSWYGFDGHGSVRYLTSSSGAVTDTYDYDAFGNLINSTGSTANNYLFAGEQFDPDLGLYYNRARYLDVRAGRFWGMDDDEGASTDPISLHKYLYADANPANRVDPTGNFGEDLGIAMAIDITLSAMNAASLVSNAYTAVQSSVSAYSYFQADDPWNGTMAVGNAALHLGMAALNAYGIKSSLNLPPPPAVFATAAGNLGVQMLWLNPQFVNWTFELLWPAVYGIGGMYFASAGHTAEWELRNSKGQIKTRGNAESGGTGKSRPTIDEQLGSHTEIKILKEIQGQASPGDILTIRGSRPPCAPRGGTIGCNIEMTKAAARLGIKILYSVQDQVWKY
jgi:RHS repeat-associated protein